MAGAMASRFHLPAGCQVCPARRKICDLSRTIGCGFSRPFAQLFARASQCESDACSAGEAAAIAAAVVSAAWSRSSHLKSHAERSFQALAPQLAGAGRLVVRRIVRVRPSAQWKRWMQGARLLPSVTRPGTEMCRAYGGASKAPYRSTRPRFRMISTFMQRFPMVQLAFGSQSRVPL